MIWQFVPGIFEEASGPTYTVPSLCEALIACGWNTRIATLDYGPLDPAITCADCFPISWGPRKLGRSTSMWRFLERECRLGRVELLHNHSLWMMPNVYPGWAAKRYRLPYVVSPRGVFTEYAMSIGSRIKPLFWRLVQCPSLAAVSCYHATADSEYEDIRRMGFAQPVCVIPNGIDVPERGAGFDEPERTLLFLGRVHPNKGVETLIRAWNQTATQLPEWRLRIVGDSSDNYLDRMKQLAESLSVPRVQFAGALYGTDKFQAYREAEVYVLPSYSENFGVTVAEALAHGLPAIVTKGAPWSGLEKVAAGCWVDLTVDSLADAIRYMCARDRRSLQRMGARGKEWMEGEYAWRRIANRMGEVYEWLMGRGSLPDCVILD